jgi:hypothetical protein
MSFSGAYAHRIRTKIYRVRMSWCLESDSMVHTAGAHRDVVHAGGQPDTGSGNTGAKAWTKRSEKELVDQVFSGTGTRGQKVLFGPGWTRRT